MTKCSSCDQDFNDGVQCSACLKDFGFCCSSITEAGYRKLGAERKAAWKCARCKVGADASDLPVSQSVFLREIRELKLQLACLPKLTEDIKSIKSEISELKASCEFAHASLKEQESKIGELESKVAGIQGLAEALDAANKEITTLKDDMAEKDQRARANNIEIKGIPVKTDENLFSIFESVCSAIKFNVPKSCINYIARVPTKDPKQKSIIVTINNRYTKEDFIATARAKENRQLKLSDISILKCNSADRVYINDHLTPQRKNLLNKVKTITNQKDYAYVWVKHCKIHVRKNDQSPVFVIAKEGDLNKLV